jgi:hypothetical protein
MSDRCALIKISGAVDASGQLALARIIGAFLDYGLLRRRTPETRIKSALLRCYAMGGTPERRLKMRSDRRRRIPTLSYPCHGLINRSVAWRD